MQLKAENTAVQRSILGCIKRFVMYVVLFFSFLSLCIARPMDDPLWRGYKLKFGKFYNDFEESVRYEIWSQNVKEISMHNAENSNSYKQGINQFTDMTREEFRLKMGGCYKIPEKYIAGNITSRASTFIPPSNVEVPDSVNWVTQGYVTPVKNQGQCGSCWSFSTTGSLEGQIVRKTGHLPSLSEQQLVDCSSRYGTRGCHGGWMESAFEYIRDNNGIDSEAAYPYYARQLNYCYFKRQNVSATCTGFVDLRPGDENSLKFAVATIGPISVAIDATHPSFARYSRGVYYESACGNTLRNLDHAVLVVGYGSEGGRDYWLVKNSWGTRWGDKGYIKMARNYNNQCGIATKASYPLV